MDMPTQSPGEEVRAFAEAVVAEPSRSEDVRAQVDKAIAAVVEYAERLDDPRQIAPLKASVALLAAARTTMQSIGECHLAEPFADVYVVLTADGPRYCCKHNPQHCAP